MPKLTPFKVESEKPNKHSRKEIPDTGKPGLYLVVQPSGRKSWAVRYRRRSDGKPRKYTLDGFPSLAKAHRLAQDVLDQVAEGNDPAAAKIVEKRQRETGDPSDIEALFIEFLRRHNRKKNGQPIKESSKRQTAGYLGLKLDKEGKWIRTGNGVLKRWRGRTVESITKGDVLALMDDMVEDAPISANRTLAALRTFFGWCIKRDKLDRSPCAGIDDPAPEEGRERPLSDVELVALWKAVDAMGGPFGRMVQLLILTGCRRDEVRKAHWREFDLEQRKWLIPGVRTKNGHDHLVPLSDAAVEVVQSLPRHKGSDLLFTATGATPVSNLSRLTNKLRAAVAKETGQPEKKWNVHDLRHTLKTWMQGARIAKDVRNAVQNHSDGDMDEHYGHHTFEAEKRDALDRWARHVLGLVEGKTPDNVIPMSARA
jgi:integrase